MHLLFRDFALSFVVAVGFALLFNTPRRVLLVAGFLGGVGHCLRYFLHNECDVGIISATLAGTVTIGLLGIPLSHRVHVPPVVFTMPACITMIPGLYAYRSMLGLIRLTDHSSAVASPHLLAETTHYIVLTTSMLFALAIGICSGALLFRTKTTKTLFTFKRTF